MKQLWILLATGFGLGLSPIASGTAGTLLGIPIAWWMAVRFQEQILIQVGICVVLTAVSILICDRAESIYGRKDDGRIVADEYLTFPVSMIGLPPSPVMLGVAFVTNRFFDILKPPPANGFQSLTGGVGITIDDVVAALYSLALNWILYAWVLVPRGWV